MITVQIPIILKSYIASQGYIRHSKTGKEVLHVLPFHLEYWQEQRIPH